MHTGVLTCCTKIKSRNNPHDAKYEVSSIYQGGKSSENFLHESTFKINLVLNIISIICIHYMLALASVRIYIYMHLHLSIALSKRLISSEGNKGWRYLCWLNEALWDIIEKKDMIPYAKTHLWSQWSNLIIGIYQCLTVLLIAILMA